MIPAVDGLLAEPHNSMILTLLYCLAEWHALAKLRMHTDCTLDFLEKSTTTIGRELRRFRDTSLSSFKCQELPVEIAARERRRERAQAKKAQSVKGAQAPGTSTNMNEVPDLSTNANEGTSKDKDASSPKTKPKAKTLNLFTYKFHALGDYVRTIQLFGTTDSYSTQIVKEPFLCPF